MQKQWGKCSYFKVRIFLFASVINLFYFTYLLNIENLIVNEFSGCLIFTIWLIPLGEPLILRSINDHTTNPSPIEASLFISLKRQLPTNQKLAFSTKIVWQHEFLHLSFLPILYFAIAIHSSAVRVFDTDKTWGNMGNDELFSWLHCQCSPSRQIIHKVWMA